MTVHEIVSNVDAVIVLQNPCVEFARWEQPVLAAPQEVERVILRVGKKKKKSAKKGKSSSCPDSGLGETNNGGPSLAAIVPDESSAGHKQSTFGAGPSNATQPIVIPDNDGLENNSKSTNPADGIDSNAQEAGPVPEAPPEPIGESRVLFRVCAGNLMSASLTFNLMLTKEGWMESIQNPEDRMYHLSASDWDEEAFTILMNIFHHRNNKVPRTVTLEMLAKIAVLVDYYKCDEAVELFKDHWLADLRKKTPVPTTYCRDLILWVWVAWTFRLSDLFKDTTAVVIYQCNEPVRTLDLPIPSWISST
jgi:hypothetical protein